MLKFTNLRGDQLGDKNDVSSKLYVKPKPKVHETTPTIGIDGMPERGETMHKGYAVVGRPPGAIKSSQELAERLCAEWASMSGAKRSEALKNGQRPPLAWDLNRYLKTKPPRVRSKPYEIPSAAEECAEMARKTGWEYVEVVPLVSQ